MLVSQKVLDILKTIGLNLYERKLWVALLAKGIATAGELSEMTGVPRSRTYDVLESLADKGFAMIQHGKPIRFIAIKPTEAIELAKRRLRERFDEAIQRLERLKESEVAKELEELYAKSFKTVTPEEVTGVLRGDRPFLRHLELALRNSNKQVEMILSQAELESFARDFKGLMQELKEKGVEIKIITSETPKPELMKEFDGLAKVGITDIKLDKFFLIDDSQAIFPLTSGERTENLAIWTKSQHAGINLFKKFFDEVWSKTKPLT